MNDYKNNWFYKLCKKQCAKDTWLIVIGAALVMFCFWMLTVSFVPALAVFIAAGLFLVGKGVQSYVRWLPDVKRYLMSMSQNEFTAFSAVMPQCMYGTFYFTERYLCIPSQFIMLRYAEIGNMSTKPVYHHKYGQKGVDLIVEYNDGRAPVNIHVKDWQVFQNDTNNFMMLVQQHRQIGMQY